MLIIYFNIKDHGDNVVIVLCYYDTFRQNHIVITCNSENNRLATEKEKSNFGKRL